MSLYLVAGVGASTDAATPHDHLPSARTRRYPSDMTDAEWQVLAPLVPAGRPGPRGGRPPAHSRRDIIDAIRYITHNGGVWRALPADFPPWKTVHDYHTRWSADGTVSRIHNTLREQVRTAEGRNPDPSAALVDSQSVKSAEPVTAGQRSSHCTCPLAGGRGARLAGQASWLRSGSSVGDVGGVGHPVSGGCLLPGDGDLDVDAERAGEDGGGDLRGEAEQRGGAVSASVDADLLESLAEVIGAEGLVVSPAGEQSGCVGGLVEDGVGPASLDQFKDEVGEWFGEHDW
jgi:transposase